MVVIKGSTPGGSRGRALLRLVVEGVLDGDVVALREGAEAVDALHGACGGEVEAGRAAAGPDADVGGHAVAADVEDEGDALPDGGARVGLLGVPVVGNLLVDDSDVVRKPVAEGAVLDGYAGGAVLELHRRLGDADAGGLAGCGLGGGSVFSLVTTGAGLGVSEVRTPVSRSRCFGGSGKAETMVAWMAPAVMAVSPQLLPFLWKRKAEPKMSAATSACRAMEPTKLPARFSPLPCSSRLNWR